MTAKDYWALLVLVMLLFSTLIWVGSWVSFMTKARKKQVVNRQAIRKASIRIGVGAVCSGLLFVIMGLVLQAPPRGGIPISGYIYLFTVCPGIFVLAVLAGFLRTAIELRSKYEVTKEPDEEQDHVDSHVEHPAR